MLTVPFARALKTNYCAKSAAKLLHLTNVLIIIRIRRDNCNELSGDFK